MKKILVVVNRWTGRPEPSLYRKMLRLWDFGAGGFYGVILKVLDHKKYTHEKVHRKAMKIANQQGFPYFALVDDDARVSTRSCARAVKAFEKHPDVAKIVPMTLGMKITLASKKKTKHILKTDEKLWIGFGAEFFRTKACVESRCFKDQALIFEDRLSSLRLLRHGWKVAQFDGLHVEHEGLMRGGVRKSISLQLETQKKILKKYPNETALHKMIDKLIRMRKQWIKRGIGSQKKTSRNYFKKR